MSHCLPRTSAALALALTTCSPPPPSSPPPPPTPPSVAAPSAPSPLDEARRAARAALAAGDIAGALKHIDRAVDHAADSSAAVVVRCERAALLSQLAASVDVVRERERALRAALVDCPDGEGVVHLKQGLADTLLRRAREADTDSAKIALLRESVATAETVAALVDLALALERDNDPAGAAEAAARAHEIAPEHQAVTGLHERLARQRVVEGGFRSARHSHFVARFEGYGDERLAWGALDSLESAYFAVGKALDLYPREAVTVVIYTGEQYRQATAGPDWSTGLFDGKIRIREGQLAADKGSLDDTLVHEYVHAALHTLPVPVPPWFHEGLAQHFEARRPKPALVMARVGRAPREALDVPFVKLPNDVVPAAYATSHALVERMVERRGAWGLNQLVGELKAGRSFDEAVERAFAVSVDALYRDVASP